MTNAYSSKFSDTSKSFFQKRLESLIAESGVEFNGNQPWDIQVLDKKFYQQVFINGSLGLGESYMNRLWDCVQVDELINRLLRSKVANKHTFLSHMVNWVGSKVLNLQSKTRAFEVGKKHYDIGNDLYQAMLDENMVYTCGYWANSHTLEEAQIAKLDLICKKLGLQPGMRILDIGCGWGSFAKYAAQNYGVDVVGITISQEQAALAQEMCNGLTVEIRVQDYRDVQEKFDSITSIGMFEHVGHKNYKIYMQVANRCLNSEGYFLLHTIGKNNSRTGVDPWAAKYIFPNGEIPSLKQINDAVEPLFLVEDIHNFGPDYDKTLMSWSKNFDDAWDTLKVNYPDKFYRMWKYYLLVCAGAFRARNLQLWQIMLSKGLPAQAYRRPR